MGESDGKPEMIDPLGLVRQLDAGIIRSRLDDIDRERAALLVLLRAALRTKRDKGKVATKRERPKKGNEVDDG